LRVLRRLFIVDKVMPEIVERLFRGHVEDMGSAGIDDDLEIGLTGDGLTLRGRCPVVFLANQDESANRWVDAVVTERIVGDDRAPRGRELSVREDLTRIIVDWSGSWQAARPGNWLGRSPATKAALGC